MKCVYISPSVQQFNEYLNGGNEEQYMNLVADSLIRYLDEYGICYTRNSPDMSVPEIIRQSNSGDYILHLAIHSNASPESLSGELMGSEVFYYPSSPRSALLAQIVADNLKTIYPYPDMVVAKTSTSFAELRRTRAPSVLVEVAYHDNPEDEAWIKNNVDEIGRVLALSVKEYIDETCECPRGSLGEVITMGGNLNVRRNPNINSEVVSKIPNGTKVEILDCSGRWYRISYQGNEGYVFKHYVSI
ncbi:MAG: peptidoglycan hydrolase [Ruminococcaceae bacterium]|nr:peptidoglycan hydrolase [Oscillospiraceae bacterium]